MVKLYNPNCKLASVRTSNVLAFDLVRTHFLTYNRNEGNDILGKECITSSVSIMSRLEKVQQAGVTTQAQIETEDDLKALYQLAEANGGMILLYLTDEESIRQMVPIEPK